ncbi:MAG: hypothetical protein M5U28_18430 [Sandaracinaceae bacterium]|nr:hypothetical protein [Sandaracinaceae bacterium]
MPHSYEPDTVLLGKLRVIGELGAGAMGTVYEVEHLLTKHRRALKVLHEELLQRGAPCRASCARRAWRGGSGASAWSRRSTPASSRTARPTC